MTGSETVFPASGTRSVAVLIDHDPVSGELLGAFPTAAYLQLSGGEVIAVLTRDAVRLPCGLVLAQNSSELPLDRLRGPVLVGHSRVSIGSLAVRLVRIREAAVATGLLPRERTVAELQTKLDQSSFNEHDPSVVEALAHYADSEALARKIAGPLVGAGSGLTPSGDDILSGFFVAARAVGLPCPQLTRVVTAAAGSNTTTLSAALLQYASQGETLPQISRLLQALSRELGPREDALDALARVVAIGHTSGTAMAIGVLAACQSSLRQT